MRGGIPERDIEDPVRLGPYWAVLPSVRAALFAPLRPRYCQLRLPIAEVKPAIFAHPEFTAFQAGTNRLFDTWTTAITPLLKALNKGSHPKPLIEDISERLLAAFKTAPLLDAYDLYQHLMDYWAATLQDDCYLIAAVGWTEAAQPREIIQTKNKDNKLVWAEDHDFNVGKRRFKSDLLSASLLIERYFVAERDALAALELELASLEQQLEEKREEQSGEDGLLAEVIEGEGDKQKITVAKLKARLKEIGKDADYAEERAALKAYAALLDTLTESKAKLKAAQTALEAKLAAKYPTLSEDDCKSLAIDAKWLPTIQAAVQGELDRVSHSLTGRIRQLAERYETPLPEIEAELATLSSRVEEHLRQMGEMWT
jgi:type I restriction enzyme M protein